MKCNIRCAQDTDKTIEWNVILRSAIYERNNRKKVILNVGEILTKQ